MYELGESDNENKNKTKKENSLYSEKKHAKYNKKWCKPDLKFVVWYF